MGVGSERPVGISVLQPGVFALTIEVKLRTKSIPGPPEPDPSLVGSASSAVRARECSSHKEGSR